MVGGLFQKNLKKIYFFKFNLHVTHLHKAFHKFPPKLDSSKNKKIRKIKCAKKFQNIRENKYQRKKIKETNKYRFLKIC